MAMHQGSFESTSTPTDLAIGGDGMFIVRGENADDLYYTRAGNFRFDMEGYLVNPEGMRVQGWVMNEDGMESGSIADVQLNSFTSSPEETQKMTLITNLDSGSDSNSAVLHSQWDSSNDPPIDAIDFEYQATVKVYDSLGESHDVTIYYDKGVVDDTWEYMITCNPEEDMRAGAGPSSDASVEACAGLLARGTLTFDASSGHLAEGGTPLTVYRFDDTPATVDWTDTTAAGNWAQQTVGLPPPAGAGDMSINGYFEIVGQFITGQDVSIELDLGTVYDGTNWENDAVTTTEYSKASTTTFQAADGFKAGELQDVDVNQDGIVKGIYSNGELIELNRVALAKFIDYQGLRKEGGSLFRETRESGEAIVTFAGTNGLGAIAPNSLEMSNVDIANEFVKMITNQRGYQANSKIISTVDQLLQEIIQLKR